MMTRQFGAPANAGWDRDQSDLALRGTASRYERELGILGRELQKNPAFGDSIALQTRWRTGLPTYSWEEKLDRRSALIRLRANAWKEVSDFIYYYRNIFEQRVALEVDNWDFYYGFQWDDQEIKRMQNIGMVPHVSNYMSRWARTLIGEKRGTETVFNFESEDDSLKSVTEFYNQVCGKIARANKWPYRSGGAFANYVIGGRSVMSVRPDPFSPFRNILMGSERPQEFMYDFEHAKDGSLDGCNYLMRNYYRDLEDVIFEYPEFEDFLTNYDYSITSGIENILLFQISQPKVAPTAYKRVVETPSRFVQRPFFQRRRLAYITEFYRIEREWQWTVRDGNFNVEYDFDAADMAAKFYRDLRDTSIAKNIALTGKPGIDLIDPPQRQVRKKLNTEIWCSDVLLDSFTRRVGKFPYIFTHCEFHDGNWRGFFEDDKPNQKMRNKTLLLLDMALGNLKPKTWYHRSLFSKEATDKQIQAIIRDPMKGEVGHWDLKNIDPKRLTMSVQPTNVDGQTLRTLTEFIEKASSFSNGGLNSIGDAEFAGQSDKLRQGLQGAAQTGTVGLMEDWLEGEAQVGQHLAYTAQGLSPTVLLEYVNAEDRERFLPLLQSMSHSIDMDKITMEVSEIVSGPTRSNQQAADLLTVAGQDPEMLSDVMPEIMRLRHFPQAMVDRIDGRQASRAQAQSAQAQHEQEMSDAMETSKMQINQEKLEIEKGRLELEANPPVQFSLAGKVNAPGPDAMAAIYEQHGIPADPQHIEMSERKQDSKDQERDDIRQQKFQEISLPYEKSLASLHPVEGKTSAGVRSPKDRNNRSRKKAEKSKTRV